MRYSKPKSISNLPAQKPKPAVTTLFVDEGKRIVSVSSGAGAGS